MGPKALRYIVLAALVIGTGVVGRGPLSAAIDRTGSGATTSKSAVARSYGDLPVSFAPNRGQAGDGIDFVAQGTGYGLSLGPTGASLALTKGARSERPQVEPSASASSPLAMPGDQTGPATVNVVNIDLLGADPGTKAVEQDRLGGRVNYLTGSDTRLWHTDLPTFGRVTYQGVYPGVDLTYYGNQDSLEYDFIVAPGSDPGRIALAFQGADSLSLDTNGDLVVAVPGGELRQHPPRIYQDSGSTRSLVQGRFVLQGDNQVGFEIDAFDRSRPLVIDPVLGYSTFLGATRNDAGLAIEVDAAGFAYVAGSTSSAGFPTTAGAHDRSYNGNQDAFVAKLTPDGSSLVYSTFIGGSGRDDADAVAIDSAGAAYVRGITVSPDFPATSGAFDTTFNGGFDVWVGKVSPDGSSLGFASFLGGPEFDSGSGIDVDAQGSVYVAGLTGSPGFPITPGAYGQTFHGVGGPNPPPVPPPGDYDAYSTKFTPDGSALDYSTFLGGASLDAAFEVAVDPMGRAAVTGVTLSADYPTTPAAFDTTFGGITDTFVTRLAPDGSDLVYSTFIGGSGRDGALGLDVEPNGAVLVGGGTSSPDFPTTPGAFDTSFNGGIDAFVAKLSPNGSSLRFSTFLGGTRDEGITGLVVDTAGASYVTGDTQSRDFPTTSNAYDTSYNGGTGDAFVTKITPMGTGLAYSSYLGGLGGEGGSDIDVGPAGAAYVSGVTRSADFPTTPGAFSTTLSGPSDAFVTKVLIR